jgi:hypothetical protein
MKIEKVKNLNEEVYSRFDLKIDIKKAQEGFLFFVKNSIIDILHPITNPSAYKDSKEFFEIQSTIIDKFSRSTFRDKNSFYDSYNKPFNRLLDDIFNNPFDKALVDLQILINLVFKYYEWNEFNKFIKEIEKYLKDFPIIGLNIKQFKTKAPQFFSSRSKFFDELVLSLLGELEDKKYNESLKYFGLGIKNFIKVNSKTELKKIVDDMHVSVDEFIKVFTNDENKSFRSIFPKKEYQKYGFKNSNQKEIFKNLKYMIDKIKHGQDKNFDKNDIEMIINLTASLLRFLLKKEYAEE